MNDQQARPDILVLGATGLMGRHVLEALRARGAGARVLVRDPARLERADGLDVRVGDLRDEPSLRAALDGVRVVFHISPHEADEVALTQTVVRASRTPVCAWCSPGWPSTPPTARSPG